MKYNYIIIKKILLEYNLSPRLFFNIRKSKFNFTNRLKAGVNLYFKHEKEYDNFMHDLAVTFNDRNDYIIRKFKQDFTRIQAEKVLHRSSYRDDLSSYLSSNDSFKSIDIFETESLLSTLLNSKSKFLPNTELETSFIITESDKTDLINYQNAYKDVSMELKTNDILESSNELGLNV